MSIEEMIEYSRPCIFINHAKYYIMDSLIEGMIEVAGLKLLMQYEHYRYQGHYDFYTDTTPVIPPKTDDCFESPLW